MDKPEDPSPKSSPATTPTTEQHDRCIKLSEWEGWKAFSNRDMQKQRRRLDGLEAVLRALSEYLENELKLRKGEV